MKIEQYLIDILHPNRHDDYDIPKPKFESALSTHELNQIPKFLIKQRKSCKHIWSIEEISALIEKEFGVTINTKQAYLTPLGRKLANVDPW